MTSATAKSAMYFAFKSDVADSLSTSKIRFVKTFTGNIIELVSYRTIELLR